MAALATSRWLKGPPQRESDDRGRCCRHALQQQLAGNRIEIQAKEGVVTLTGVLGSPVLKSEAGRERAASGVRQVVDQLQVANDGSVRTVQYQPNQRWLSARISPAIRSAVTSFTVAEREPEPSSKAEWGPEPSLAAARDDVWSDQRWRPMPEGRLEPRRTQAAQPGYPNYAWPSLRSSYPNSGGRLPDCLPRQAWPNIGPFYPIPKSRSIAPSLFVDDCIWWLDFKKHHPAVLHPHPFGLFAY